MGVPFDTGQDSGGGAMTTIGGLMGGPVGAVAGSVASGLFSGRQARKQMQFQERMASTQFQRAAKDLEAAGLNRVLALGSPAAAPGGAMGSMPDIGQSGMTGMRTKQDVSMSKSQQGLVPLTAQSIKASTAKELATAGLIAEQTRLTNAEADKAQFTKAAYEKFYPELMELLGLAKSGISSARAALPSLLDKAGSMFEATKSTAKDVVQEGKEIVRNILRPGQKEASKADAEWNRKQAEWEEWAADKRARERARQKDREL